MHQNAEFRAQIDAALDCDQHDGEDDPATRQVGQCSQIARRRQHLGLEATRLARRGRMMIHGAPADDLGATH
jgi:hypothetical protein